MVNLSNSALFGLVWRKMEEILHQLISSISHYLQGSIHPRWCRISSINSIFIDPYINTHILHGVVTHNFPRVKDPSCSSLKIWGMDRVRSGNPGTLGREGGRDAGKAMLFFFFSFLSKEVGLFFCWASFFGGRLILRKPTKPPKFVWLWCT